MNLGLSFLRGLVAAVNPCAFVLLPTYLMYFLGIEAGREGPARSSVQRALTVAAAVSSGFMLVFVVAGVISNFFTSWLDRNAKYATAAIGVGLIVLGAAMLFGYRLPLSTVNVSGAGRDRTVRSMFVYGVAYAVASLSCTIALFAATAFAAPDSFVEGVANVVAFGLGMALIVTALTVSLAFANQALLACDACVQALRRPARRGVRPDLGRVPAQVLLGRRRQRGHRCGHGGRRATAELDPRPAQRQLAGRRRSPSPRSSSPRSPTSVSGGVPTTRSKYLRPCMTLPPAELPADPSSSPPFLPPR